MTMTIHEILGVRGGWRETFAVWWSATWRSALLAGVFSFFTHVGGALIGLNLEERTLLGQLAIYPATFFGLRWVLKQQIIKYFPGNGYHLRRRRTEINLSDKKWEW